MPQRSHTCIDQNSRLQCSLFTFGCGHTSPSLRVVCRVINWLSNKFQAKEAQQQVNSWIENVETCLADIVQDVGSFSTKPYVELSKNERMSK